jgi:hypothetical protein
MQRKFIADHPARGRINKEEPLSIGTCDAQPPRGFFLIALGGAQTHTYACGLDIYHFDNFCPSYGSITDGNAPDITLRYVVLPWNVAKPRVFIAEARVNALFYHSEVRCAVCNGQTL